MLKSHFYILVLLLIGIVFVAKGEDLSFSPRQIAANSSGKVVGVYAKCGDDKYYGTGVLLSPKGYILTSTTVVPQNAESIEIYFADHKKLSAEIVSSNESVESTLLKVNSQEEPFPYLQLSLSPVLVGEASYTLGNANNMIKLGDGASFSAGVISGVYQVESVDSQSGYVGGAIETTASVNPGQDGGPLLDSRGRVIGIISRSFSPLRWQGVAVPIISIMQEMKIEDKVSIATDAKVTNSSTLSSGVLQVKDALVNIEVERNFKPEKISRLDWSEFKKGISDWDSLSEIEQRKITADFFAADNLLAANQMLRRPEGAVSGLLVSPDGFILTSAFNVQSSDVVYQNKKTGLVQPPKSSSTISAMINGGNNNDLSKTVNRVRNILVTLPDGKTVQAKVTGFHIPLGLALLKVTVDRELPFIDITKNSRKPVLGEKVFLLGASLSGFTLNSGIISAVKRQENKFLQFDALLNYGNSGGPIVSEDGKFLGLATAALNPAPIMGKILPFKSSEIGELSIIDYKNVPNSGIGMAALAAGVEQAVSVMQQGAGITRGKEVYLGFSPSTESKFSTRVIVGKVFDNSPALKGGIKSGDMILQLDGLGVRSWKEIFDYLREKSPGDGVTFTIFRPLDKPYLFIGDKKLTTGEDFLNYLEEAGDGTELTAKVYRPGIEQKVYIKLGSQ